MLDYGSPVCGYSVIPGVSQSDAQPAAIGRISSICMLTSLWELCKRFSLGVFWRLN